MASVPLPVQCQIDFALRRLLGLLDEGPEDHHALLFRGDVERAGDAGLPFQADLPQLPADVADVWLLHVRQAHGLDQFRNIHRAAACG
jgi:hypothetical protein